MDQRHECVRSGRERDQVEGCPALAPSAVGMGHVPAARIEPWRRGLPVVILGAAGHGLPRLSCRCPAAPYGRYGICESQVESCFTRFAWK
jgi:hypothetical protein